MNIFNSVSFQIIGAVCWMIIAFLPISSKMHMFMIRFGTFYLGLSLLTKLLAEL